MHKMYRKKRKIMTNPLISMINLFNMGYGNTITNST